jgi:ESS family glutamate:Na+ symporter
MEWSLNEPQTILVAISVLFIGQGFRKVFKVLQKYNLPDPVIGGVIISIVIALLYSFADVHVEFDTSQQQYFMLAFFATIGLNANYKLLMKGGKGLFIFMGLCLVFLIFQNLISTSLVSLMGMDPRIGLLCGSVTLSGGHGTGAVYAEVFSKGASPLKNAPEIAMACATFGLILGGLIGGPVAELLIKRRKLSPSEAPDEVTNKFNRRNYKDQETVSTQSMLETLGLVIVCVTVGLVLFELLEKLDFTLPAFVETLFIGILISNVVELTGCYKFKKESMTVIGNISLAMFLAMAMMDIKLWRLVSLAGPLSVVLIVQTIFTFMFTYYITFKVMGRDFDAATISAGHCGFGMGSTPTAVANMDAITKKHGPSPRAFLIVPLVGAFFLDIMNALVIQAFIYFI